MQFDDLLSDSEAEARPALGLRVRAVDLVELLENARSVLFGNARTRIRHAYSEAAIRGHGPHAYFSSVRELDGVAYEVEQHLRETLFVAQANG